jgi:hypothetical protein
MIAFLAIPTLFTAVHRRLSRTFFPAPVLLAASLVFFILTILPLPASAWNIPRHMLSGIIAYQVLRQKNPPTIEKVKAVLEKHPWYANQWQARLKDVPAGDRGLVPFMQAERWGRVFP